MLRRFCFSLLLLQTLCTFKVSAQNDLSSDEDDEIGQLGSNFNEISDPLVRVEYEVARAGYIAAERYIANGDVQLHCEGAKEIKHNIYWSKDGVRQDSAEFYESDDVSTVTSIYKLVSPEEAEYECNGIFVYMIKPQEAKESQNASIYRNSKVTCIDRIGGEETKTLQRMQGAYKTAVEYFVGLKQPFYPVKRRTITDDITFQCNNTKNFHFDSFTRPVTTVEFKGKKVICRNTDNAGRCKLEIYFGDKKMATGVSPTLEYTYKKINIQQVQCYSNCTIGEYPITLEVQDIEINRTLYICVIIAIILIILILIIILLCVLWHRFGFKEKYGYQINMKLKKNFAVDTNKLSSYRMSGVAADVPVEMDGSDPDVVKEFRDMDDDGSLDDSFVDPNFARTNNKMDMRSKDDISSSGASNQRPFLRI